MHLGKAAGEVFFPAWEREIARPARRWLRRICVQFGNALLALAPAPADNEAPDS